MATTKTTEIYEGAGVAEGTVENGETIVYDRDEDNNVIGWHKEPVGE